MSMASYIIPHRSCSISFPQTSRRQHFLRMSLIENLPGELLSHIASTWLTIVDVAHVDSALCCSTIRGSFVESVYTMGPVLQHPTQLCQWRKSSNAMNEWIFRRSAPVSGLFATMIFLRDNEKRKTYLERHGANIQWIQYNTGFRSVESSITQSSIDVAQYCPRLTRFEASHCHDDTAVVRIAQGCPLLVDLKLFGNNYTSKSVYELSKWCHKLQRVQLECNAARLDEECLVALIRSNPDLLVFGTDAATVTDRLVQELADHCTNLIGLRFTEAFVSETTFRFLMKKCTNLEDVILSCGGFSPAMEEPEPLMCANVRRMCFTSLSIDDLLLDDQLRACPGLHFLGITGCLLIGSLNDAQIGTRCPDLRMLSLSYNRSHAGNKLLLDISQHCPRLTALRVPHPGSNYRVTDAGLIALAQQCPLLEELDITGCAAVTDVSLCALAQSCQGLKTLRLRNCEGVTAKGVTAIMQNCPRLAVLDVHGCSLITSALAVEIKARYAVTRQH